MSLCVGEICIYIRAFSLIYWQWHALVKMSEGVEPEAVEQNTVHTVGLCYLEEYLCNHLLSNPGHVRK